METIKNKDSMNSNHNSSVLNSKQTIKKPVKIVLYKHQYFQSSIEVFDSNKNYFILKAISRALYKAKKSWKWLFDTSLISKNVWDSYLSSRDHFSLSSIENIAELFRKHIDNPKELMDDSFPSLFAGNSFELNIGHIMKRYNLTYGDVIHGTKLDSGHLSNIVHGKTKCLRYETISKLFSFFRAKGIPLRTMLDLLYFPTWNETPLHFLENRYVPRKSFAKKFNSRIRVKSN